MKLIERSFYLDRLKDLRDTPDIKIITGIRRAGKSELIRMYMKYIAENDKSTNVIFIDFYDIKFEDLKEYHKLNDYIEGKYVGGKNNCLFIDEVQLCKNFEVVINSLHASGKYDIYITGSNAFLLSNDLATLFTGRYIELHVFPFSFKEFTMYYSELTDIDEAFDAYVKKGGLAGSYAYKSEIDRVNYLKDVYNTIVNRDLVAKYKMQDTLVLDHLSEYLMDNISNLTSPNKVSDALVSNKIKTNHATIGRYVKYLCNAYMFYDVKRYDIKGKRYLETSDKYYMGDVGFRFAVLGSKNLDYGRLYENIVCVELLRRGYEVYVGKLYQKEVDFIAKRGNEQVYIQVCDNIGDERTFKREYESLLQIVDAYPKMIIARTKHDEYYYEGIKICDIARWLSEIK